MLTGCCRKVTLSWTRCSRSVLGPIYLDLLCPPAPMYLYHIHRFAYGSRHIRQHRSLVAGYVVVSRALTLSAVVFYCFHRERLAS